MVESSAGVAMCRFSGAQGITVLWRGDGDWSFRAVKLYKLSKALRCEAQCLPGPSFGVRVKDFRVLGLSTWFQGWLH